jgi:hypothetical protein
MWVPKIYSCSMKCSRCCVMNDTSRGEKRTSSRCAERNTLCAWTASWASARICSQCWVCSSARVEGVLSSGIHGRAGTRGEPEVCARSTGSAALSAQWGRRRPMWRPQRAALVCGWMMGVSVDGWLCCVVLGCVVLCCVRLRCVVLCCVVLWCAVLCCIVLCCAVLGVGWGGWCCVVLC